MPPSPKSDEMPPSGKRRKTVPPVPPEPLAEPEDPPEPGACISPALPQATVKIAEATKTCARVLLPMSLLPYLVEGPENTQNL
jgi:hypothetical protein